jgi:hypothetical protein
LTLVVLKIPTGPTSFVKGECTIAGYEDLILCEGIAYEISVEDEINADGRRTVHSPQLSVVTIERQLDVASADITRMALSHRVSALPWEIFMLADAEGGFAAPVGGGTGPAADGTGDQHACVMTLKLHHPLITKQDISADEGGVSETIEVSAAAIEWRYMVIDPLQRPIGHLGFRFNTQTGTLA